MIAIAQKKVDEKFDALPEVLKDALFSVYNAEEIRRIGTSQFLSSEKISLLARITGRVIMGFIHEDDFVKAVKDDLGLPAETAGLIAREIDRKILFPLKDDIRKAYEPLGEERTAAPVVETEPKEQSVPIRREAAGPVPVPLETLRIAPEPAPVPGAAPAAAATKAPEPIMPLRPVEPVPAKIHPFALGEMPAKPAVETAPAPFMLHKEEALTPILESKTVQIQREAAPRPEAGKATAVRLEMTGLEEEGAKKREQRVVAKTEVPQQRVVHYSAFRTPVNPFGGEAAAPSAPATPAPAPASVPVPAKVEAPKPTPPKVPSVAEARPRPAAKEEVIDLSTFQRTPAAPAAPKAVPQQDNPKLDGNVVDLRGQQ